MKQTVTIIVLSISSIFSYHAAAQTHPIFGRVLADDLSPLPGVQIQIADRSTLGETDSTGRFKISIPKDTQTLFFRWIGWEQVVITLSPACDTLEIVMLPAATYDFMSSRKIDRLRLKDFKKLPDLYLQAYNKGLFSKSKPCYTRQFKPDKPVLDSIEKVLTKERKQIKLAFKKFNIGDTIKIPFSGGYKYDGTDRTTLIRYSYFAHKKTYDVIVQCIIIKKNTLRRAFNLVCKVIDIKLDKPPAFFQEKEMVAGDIFTYNMGFFKVLTNDGRELYQ